MSPLLTRCATLLTAAALTGAGVAAHAVLQDDPTVGAPTLGDTYTPTNGNGGIDLQHTALNLSYDPPNTSTRSVLGGRMRAGTAYPVARQTTPAPTPAPTTPPKQAHLWGSATLTLKATQELSKFHLDLYDNVKPLKVTIDGRDAAFTHAAKKLAITPSARINPGQTFTAEVTYDCVWAYTNDQDSGSGGFNVTEGGVIVASQPVGSPAWFPTNDHPTDKGTYTVTMSVPKGLTVAGNGLPTQPVTTGNRTSFTWKASDPMASYLVTMCVGPYELITSTGPRGLPIINAIDKRIPAERRAQIDAELAQVPAMIELFESKWGPYPFEAYGHIIDTLDLGFALETQTRSVISARMSTPTVIAHELTHQWFGNSTSVQRWQDIWTNEGFATWGSWEWLDSGKATTSPRIPAGQQFNTVMTRGDDAFWSVIIGDPGRKNLFNRAVYNRGGATLYALRAKVGVEKFDTLMKNYVAATKGGNARVEDFEAWAAKSSGVDLAPFFTEWLRTGKKPAYTPAPETRGPAGVALPVEQPAHRGLQ